jgi:hypothetical protein
VRVIDEEGREVLDPRKFQDQPLAVDLSCR